MKIIAEGITNKGGRESNQDYFSMTLTDQGACLIACDGLGSYYGSEIASACACEFIAKEFVENEAKVDANYVKELIASSHTAIVDNKETNPQLTSSCTTIALVATNYEATVIAHIGDSRVYHFKNNKIVHQTIDHSLAQFAVEMGEHDDVRSHPDQNKLTRVLGSEYYIAPDIFEPNLEVGDALILCTDGFWEYVYEDEMEKDLESSLSPKSAIEKMERRLQKRIGKHNDNYTVIVAYVAE